MYLKKDSRERFWQGKESPFSYSRRNSIVREMGFKNYREYLNSPIWDAIRSAAMEKYEGRCVCCGSRATQIHHTRYIPSIMAGHPKALCYLIAVCEKCHENAEFLHSGKKDSVLGALNYIRKHATTKSQCMECARVVDFGEMVTKTGLVSNYCGDCRMTHMAKKKQLSPTKTKMLAEYKKAKRMMKAARKMAI